MRLGRVATLLILAAGLLAGSTLPGAPFDRPAYAQFLCTPPRQPVLTMTTHAAVPRQDFTRSVAELSALHAPTVRGFSKTLGLATARFGHQLSVRYRTQLMLNGQTCVTVERAELQVAILQPVVHVARELPPGSCIHREVLAHEYTHVRIDRVILEREAPHVRDALAYAIARHGAVLASSGEAGMQKIRAVLEPLLTQEIDALQQRRNAAQDRLDTAAEYQRLSGSCNGEVRKYIQPARGRQR